MHTTLIEKTLKKKALLLAALALVFGLATIITDGFESYFHGTGFYFSESLMFSSFWWLFIPFLYAQFILLKNNKKPVVHCLLAAVAAAAHLFAFPALVWLISKLFYYHTFSYLQTFRFGLSEHAIKLALLYTIPAGFYLYYRRKMEKNIQAAAETGHTKPHEFLTAFLVSEGNRHISIPLNEVLYISASSPYINLHRKNHKHLYKASLRSVCEQIDPGQFARVHKSSVVNIGQVSFFTSRLNGDYDLVMSNGDELRVSRNYARAFKEKFSAGHRVTS